MTRIKTLRTIGMALVMTVGTFLMAGCDDNPLSPNKDSVDIENLAVTNPITAGSSGDISGRVKGSEAVTITFAILDSANAAVSSSLISVNYTTVNEDDVNLATESQATLQVAAGACDGTYTLSVTAVSGTVTETKTATFVVSGGTCGTASTAVTESDVTLGAALSSNGSAYDADADLTYTGSALKGNTALQATVDVYFGVTSTGSPKLGSPTWANASGWGPETGGSWLSTPATMFLAVTGTYASLDTQEKINALWTGTGASSIAVSAGDLVVVKTSENAYALIQVVSASTTTSGDVVLKVKIKQ